MTVNFVSQSNAYEILIRIKYKGNNQSTLTQTKFLQKCICCVRIKLHIQVAVLGTFIAEQIPDDRGVVVIVGGFGGLG